MLRLRCLLPVLLALTFCAPAFADHTLVVTKSGYWILETDEAGIPTLHKVERVIKFDDGPEPQPNPTLTERAKAVRDKAAAVTDPKRAETAILLAAAYREIAKLPGAVKGQNEVTLALRTANDKLLAMQGNAAAWQPVRDLLGQQIAAVAQEGGSAGDYVALLGEVADGLEATVPQQAGARAKISPEMWAFILEIIKIILALLNKPTP